MTALAADAGKSSQPPTASASAPPKETLDEEFMREFVQVFSEKSYAGASELAADRGVAIAPELVELFVHEDHQIRHAAVGALVDMREPAFPSLMAALDDKNELRRVVAAGGLCRIHTEHLTTNLELRQALARMFADSSPKIRRAAINVFQRNASRFPEPVPYAREAVLAALEDPDPEVRHGAMMALASFKNDRDAVSPAVMAGLHADEWLVRSQAIRSLRILFPGEEFVLNEAIKILEREENRDVVHTAIGVVSGFGPKGVQAGPALAAIARGKDRDNCGAAAAALVKIGASPDLAVPVQRAVFAQYGDFRGYKGLEAYGLKPEAASGFICLALRVGERWAGLSRDDPYQIMHDERRAYIVILKALLNDTSCSPGYEWYGEALVRIPEHVSEESYALLEQALNDQRSGVRYTAYRAVEAIGLKAMAHLPWLTKQFPNGVPTQEELHKGLLALSLPILVEYLPRKRLSRQYAATQMVALGPEALPVVKDVGEVVKRTGRLAWVLAAMGPEGIAELEKVLEEARSSEELCKDIAALGPEGKILAPALIRRLSRRPYYSKYADAVYPALVSTEADLPAILPGLLDDPAARMGAFWIIQRMGEDGAPLCEHLARIIADSSLELSRDELRAAAIALASSGKGALPVVLPLWQNGDKPLRDRLLPAIEQLGPLASPTLLELIKALERRDVDDTQKAIAAMGPQAVPALASALFETHSRPMTYHVEKVLREIGPASIPPLLEAASTSPSYRAARALASMGETAVPALAECLKNADPHVRRRAALALVECDQSPSSYGRQHVEATEPHLITCLSDSDPGVVAIALRGVTAEAIPELRRLSARKDLDPAVRRAVESELFRLDRAPVQDNDASAKANTPAPDYEVVSNSLESDRQGYRHLEFSLVIEGQSFSLAKLYELEGEKPQGRETVEGWRHRTSVGFRRDSLAVSWLSPGYLLQATWTTYRNARIDVPADTTLVLLRDQTGWHEVFRSSVPGYSGYCMCNSSSNLHVSYNAKQQRIRLSYGHSTFSGDMTYGKELEPWPLTTWVEREGQKRYTASHSRGCTWPCEATAEGLVCERGVAWLDVDRNEFPLEEFVAFLNRSARAPEMTVDRLCELNPQLRGEQLGTGRIVYDDAVPPIVPNGRHRYVWASGK